MSFREYLAYHGPNHGTNARKVISEVYAFFVLSLGRKVDTRRMSHPDINSCLQILPRENWFQYVCRVYAIAINYPCISTLVQAKLIPVFKVDYPT